jgi:23S rRNA pseudouridine1911/1915/1917 synthase
LDCYLVRLGFARSRRAAADLISDGRVRVNGRRHRKGELIAPGDGVDVADTPAIQTLRSNPDLRINILFEDSAVIIADKPPLMPCHPLRSDERATVMNAMVAAYPETAYAGEKPLEGGLIHRLDNGTSGALLIARNREAFGAMRDALRAVRVTCRYRALVMGRVDRAIEITTPIAHHLKNRRKMVAVEQLPEVDQILTSTNRAGTHSSTAVVPATASSAKRHRSSPRHALTQVEPLSYEDRFTLVQVTPRTGSRHQIRVHLASVGHALAGDELYRGPPLYGLVAGRFWLHLAELEFESPAGGRVHVIAPLAPDLRDSLKHLHS